MDINVNKIKSITETVTNSFLHNVNTNYMNCIDIDGIADFLGLTIMYQNISDEEIGTVSFYSDGITPININVEGKSLAVCFPRDTIIIDNYLRRAELSNVRRTALAHEIGHHLIYMQYESLYNLQLNKQAYDKTGDMLLMPEFLINKHVQSHFGDNKIYINKSNLFDKSTLQSINDIAELLGVSFASLMLQLKLLKLIEYKEN